MTAKVDGDDEDFASVLKSARQKMGISQASFANRINQSRSAVAGYEGGKIPTRTVLDKILGQVPRQYQESLRNTPQARKLLTDPSAITGKLEDGTEDCVSLISFERRSRQVDLKGSWDAMWLTTVNHQENKNREVIEFRRRWNGSWQLENQAISDDNPKNGYIWVGRMELLDKTHLLGYYFAKESSVLAKGTMCLELQPNGREIVGVWDGLSFDTMWASGMVAMCRSGESASDPEDVLEDFRRRKPKMPYEAK